MPQPKRQAVPAPNSSCSIFVRSKEKAKVTLRCSGSPGRESSALSTGQVPISSCSHQGFCSSQHRPKTSLRSSSFFHLFRHCFIRALNKTFGRQPWGSPRFKGGEPCLGPSLGGVRAHPRVGSAHLAHRDQNTNHKQGIQLHITRYLVVAPVALHDLHKKLR